MSVGCTRFVNSRFTSNAYVLSSEDSTGIWLVDPGDVAPVWLWMNENGKRNVIGVLLTHTHFDHFYGVNEVLEHFPDCPIYVANEYGRKGLFDTRQNGSKYTEQGDIIVSLPDNVRFYQAEMLLWPDVKMEVMQTPGHSDDSVGLLVDNLFFTGDTLIKDIRTVTKIRGGSVEKLNASILKIEKLQGYGYHVCPGHNEEFELDGYDLGKATLNVGKESMPY